MGVRGGGQTSRLVLQSHHFSLSLICLCRSLSCSLVYLSLFISLSRSLCLSVSLCLSLPPPSSPFPLSLSLSVIPMSSSWLPGYFCVLLLLCSPPGSVCILLSKTFDTTLPFISFHIFHHHTYNKINNIDDN